MEDEVTRRATHRWAGTDVVAWAAAAVGLLSREPGILLLAAVGVVFVAFSRLGTPPRPDIRLTRELDDLTPVPGQEVTVRLTVENLGKRTLPDVRIVDGVPSALSVLEGSPHLGTVLRAGAFLTHTYTIQAERGHHEFDRVKIVCRSLNGAYEVELNENVETVVTANPTMSGSSDPPLRSLLSHPGGQTPTDRGGGGIEFYGVREYRSGDRANRIDWVRRARTGELATLEFREERMGTVVLLIDARTAAYVQAGTDETEAHAVEWSIRAAADVFAGLLDAGNRVGITAFGSEFVWLPPGMGDAHRRRARDVLSSHPALTPSPPRERFFRLELMTPPSKIDHQTTHQLRRLEVLLPADSQVYFLSPLADDATVTIARRVHADGHSVTAISPDVTDMDTLGARLGRLQRQRRIQALHRDNVRVIDWQLDEPLAVAFERTQVAWQ